MEEEQVGLALAKATDLRLKFSSCINSAAGGKLASPNKQNPQNKKVPNSHHHQSLGEEDEVDEESERLLNIRDALESLEHQLVALQNLYHQQRYEKEIALAGIDYSRRRLLQKLEEYEGKDVDVILEASAFVSKTVENNYDLLLPPSPSQSPRSLVFNDDISHFQSTYKPLANGFITTSDQTKEAQRYPNGHDQKKKPYKSRSSRKGVGYFFSSAVKISLPLFGAMYILSLRGSVPNLGKAAPLKFLGMLLQQRSPEENNSIVQCPPGKVQVIENGEARCLVKERIEVPFESVVAKPDVNYISG